MNKRSQWHCWEIMNCEESEDCLARKQPETPCWELVNEVGDYRSFCNICQDCIVYVLKQNMMLLSKKQKETLFVKKMKCTLAA